MPTLRNTRSLLAAAVITGISYNTNRNMVVNIIRTRIQCFIRHSYSISMELERFISPDLVYPKINLGRLPGPNQGRLERPNPKW